MVHFDNLLTTYTHELKNLVKNHKESYDYLIQNKQNNFAQLYLGNMYEKEYHVAKDAKKALKWYNLSAEQNNIGVKKDYNEAFKWYKLSADQNDSNEQNNLGELYYYGQGVQKNYNETFKWYKLSADQIIAMHKI